MRSGEVVAAGFSALQSISPGMFCNAHQSKNYTWLWLAFFLCHFLTVLANCDLAKELKEFGRYEISQGDKKATCKGDKNWARGSSVRAVRMSQI